MKKILKKEIIIAFVAFIIGLLLAGGIVYSATAAKDITYTTSKNSNIKNVNEALNDLYTKYNGSSINSVISLARATGNSDGAGKTLSWVADKDYSYIMITWAGWSEKSHNINTKGIVLYQTNSSSSYKMILYKDVKKGDSFSITAWGGNGSTETLDISTFN